MVKWFRLTKNQYLGFWIFGLAFFVLQELPYIVMPFISLKANPLMEMLDKSAVLSGVEKALGVSCIVTLMFLVRGDATWFSLKTPTEKFLFTVAITAIIIYFVGWFFYFNGFQSLPLILCILVAMQTNNEGALGDSLFSFIQVLVVWEKQKGTVTPIAINQQKYLFS